MTKREILFRGKSIDTEEWLFGDWMEYADTAQIWYTTESGKWNALVIPETRGQYTGLTDKNGVKIFEGDILRCVSEYCDKTYITEVWADGNTLCVDIEGYDFDYTAIDFAIEYWRNDRYEIEVIGNVHDNPELLGVKA